MESDLTDENLKLVYYSWKQFGNRIANEVSIRKATIKGYVNLLPYDVGTNPMRCPLMVKIWLCRRKNMNPLMALNPSGTDWGNFFQVGNTSISFQSSPLDMCFASNKDYWTVISTKSFMLSNGYFNSTASTNIAGGTGVVSKYFQFSFAKQLGKLKFNDATTTTSNKELFLVFQTVQTVPNCN